MKVVEVERIDIEENQVLNKNNIQDLIEYPLIEPVETLNNKGIKTLMSSCNKYNVKWIKDDGTNVFTRDLRKDLKYKDIYSYGYGFAYIMIDFDSMDEENKKKMEKLYIELNEGINEEREQTQAYCGKKNIIYGAVPPVRIVRDYERDSEGFLIRPGVYFYYEALKEDALLTDNAFFIENYNIIPTSTRTLRILIVRYPVNQATETSEVTDFFNAVANNMVKQEEKIDIRIP